VASLCKGLFQSNVLICCSVGLASCCSGRVITVFDFNEVYVPAGRVYSLNVTQILPIYCSGAWSTTNCATCYIHACMRPPCLHTHDAPQGIAHVRHENGTFIQVAKLALPVLLACAQWAESPCCAVLAYLQLTGAACSSSNLFVSA